MFSPADSAVIVWWNDH